MPATYTELMERFRRHMSIYTCGGNIPRLILVKPIVFEAMQRDPSAGLDLDLETEQGLIDIGIVGYWNRIPVIKIRIPKVKTYVPIDATASGWRFL